MHTLTKKRQFAKQHWVILSIFTLILNTACTHADNNESDSTNLQQARDKTVKNSGSDKRQACPANRPQICTMIYQPVCAVKANGERYTQSSDCSACAQKDVVAYESGECTKIK